MMYCTKQIFIFRFDVLIVYVRNEPCKSFLTKIKFKTKSKVYQPQVKYKVKFYELSRVHFTSELLYSKNILKYMYCGFKLICSLIF